jgi:hypothetical protein
VSGTKVAEVFEVGDTVTWIRVPGHGAYRKEMLTNLRREFGPGPFLVTFAGDQREDLRESTHPQLLTLRLVREDVAPSRISRDPVSAMWFTKVQDSP